MRQTQVGESWRVVARCAKTEAGRVGYCTRTAQQRARNTQYSVHAQYSARAASVSVLSAFHGQLGSRSVLVRFG